MKLKHVMIGLSVFAIFAVSFNIFAEEKADSKKMSNSDKAKMILEKSEKVMAQDHTEVLRSSDSKLLIRRKRSEDGVLYTRYDSYDFVKGREVLHETNLSIGARKWSLIENYALREPTMTPLPKSELEKISKVTYTYKCKKMVVDGTQCYVVSEIAKNIKDMPLPKLAQTIIRKKDYVRIEVRDYDKNGKMTTSMKYREIVFKPLDDKIFEVPKDKTIKTFESHAAYRAFIFGLYAVQARR